jgi:RNA polymerase subunit RPABC4/transcription elongation factor Spt4
MAAWVCVECTTVYSVGAPRCPHCGSAEHVEQGEDMPKITRHGGPSNAAEDLPAEPVGEAPEGGEEPSASNSCETSSENSDSTPTTSEPEAPKPARKTASRSKAAQTGSSSARSTGGGPAADTSAADK